MVKCANYNKNNNNCIAAGAQRQRGEWREGKCPNECRRRVLFLE